MKEKEIKLDQKLIIGVLCSSCNEEIGIFELYENWSDAIIVSIKPHTCVKEE